MRQQVRIVIPPLEQPPKNKTILKILRKRRLRVDKRDVKLYLARYKGLGADKDEWLLEKDLPESSTLLR